MAEGAIPGLLHERISRAFFERFANGETNVVAEIVPHDRLLCHPNDVDRKLSGKHVVKAAALHGVLCSIPRNNPVWEAIRAFWAALTEHEPDMRYACFWMGLEALFGTTEGAEVTHRLAERIALFLADRPETGRELFGKVKKCYRTRSKIMHGRWNHDPSIDTAMADTEDITRTTLLRLLANEHLMNTFFSSAREKFLEELMFANIRSIHKPGPGGDAGGH